MLVVLRSLTLTSSYRLNGCDTPLVQFAIIQSTTDKTELPPPELGARSSPIVQFTIVPLAANILAFATVELPRTPEKHPDTKNGPVRLATTIPYLLPLLANGFPITRIFENSEAVNTLLKEVPEHSTSQLAKFVVVEVTATAPVKLELLRILPQTNDPPNPAHAKPVLVLVILMHEADTHTVLFMTVVLVSIVGLADTSKGP